MENQHAIKNRKPSISMGHVQLLCKRLPEGIYHWIGLRENLQETMVFTIKYRAFL